jgi:hypothetical protein
MIRHAAKALAVLAPVLVLLTVSLAGCGGGGGGSSDARDQVVGTWSGPVTSGFKAAGDSTITFQIVKGSGPDDIQGTYEITVQVPSSRAAHSRGLFDSIITAAGSFTGTFKNNAVVASLLSGLDANGLPLGQLQQAGSAALNLANNALSGNVTLNNKTATVQTSKSSASSASGLNLKGTTWSGDTSNSGGLTIQVPNKPDIGPFPMTVNFTDQTSSGQLTANFTGGVAAGQSFTVTGATGFVTGQDVTLIAKAPSTAPTVDLGGISLPMAGRAFQLLGTVDSAGTTISGPFSVQLSAQEAALATLFGLRPDTNNYVVLGKVVLKKGAATGGGGSFGTDPVLVLDHKNNRIIGLTDVASGATATVGTLGATLNAPIDMATDANGNIYVADYIGANSQPGKVVEFNKSGALLGTYSANNATQASLIMVDKQGHIYWRDDSMNIHRIDNIQGANHVQFHTSAGDPIGLALDTGGYIYVLDGSGNRILRYDPNMTGTGEKSYGSKGNGRDNFDLTDFTAGKSANHALYIDQANHIYVADYNNFRIVRVDANALNDATTSNFTAVPLTPTGTGGSNYVEPISLTMDASEQHLFFTALETKDRTQPDFPTSGNVTGSFVERMDTSGIANHAANNLVRFGGAPGTGATQFGAYPAAVAVR